MIVALIAAWVFAAALLVALTRLQRDIRLERLEWAKERRELLNRIQAPQFVPQPQVEWVAPDQRERDEFDLVGVIQESSKSDEG